MHKSQYYFSQCIEAASKSPMAYTLGAVLVKGGKVISAGHNHHRTHYDGNDVRTHGHRKPVSMHAEMHAIFSVTGVAPSFKQQVQARGAVKRRLWCRGGAFHEDVSSGASRTCAGKSAATTTTRKAGCRDCVGCSKHIKGEKPGGGSNSSDGRSLNARRRDPRVNGADLYVVRVVKSSTGSAKPCWRCVRFDVVKVNSVGEGDVYETQADTRLFAGAPY
ncbi:hypothetical protein PAXINDRAFT_140914 [Paxillus involutus ATCC 200175]|uniref:CMP/dCMP-type deaminase domain-containing protein n=1 Tax=Paxillus involutus ATCC 200175 TaxID=664439 RepID=A0A0C9TCS4_PAXIN|nr:hypothetical protein PAXINDRAFT_140914 [Paxillus involutus ATCC 200175]